MPGACYDIILAFGPPIPCKEKYLPQSSLLPDHEVISLEAVFQENPDFGLRDVALLAVASLRKHKQVVLIDDFRLRSTRESLIKIINKKSPSSKVELVQIQPLYGFLQLMWQWQFAYAKDYNTVLKDESLVKNWFDSTSENLDFDSGYVQKPSEEEDLSIKTVNFPLQIETPHKLILPALFFQWKAELFDYDNSVLQTISALCSNWTLEYPHGRIIFIYDGNNTTKGPSYEFTRVEMVLKRLAEKIHTPVYAVQLDPLASHGTFCLPPQPGILAFLQQRHCLNLQTKGTCYIYDTKDHMQMAQTAGIRHLEMKVLLDSPDVHTALKTQGTASAIPTFLRKVIVIEENSTSESSQPTVPLYDLRHELIDGHFSKKFPQGIHEHIFIKDIATFCKYQEVFLLQVRLQRTGSTNLSERSKTIVRDKPDKCEENLPVWMKASKPGFHLKRKHSDSYRSLQTIYLMTEKELMGVANMFTQVEDESDK